MPLKLLCRKVGNTQIFIDSGECIPVTVLFAASNTVVQKKTQAKDGYSALQLSFGERKPTRTTKALGGHYAKSNTAPARFLRESRLSAEEAEAYEVGQEIKVDIFETGQRVDAIGTSKGRGFSGVIKRHNFKIKRRTHGTHENHRHGGSIGAGAYPGRVFKGQKMPGQLGAQRSTVKNLEVVRVDGERGLIYVRGSVPGHKNALVQIRPTKKLTR